jgi:hypothetical protein
LCSEEYALSEALVPAPPELIPVAVADAVISTGEGESQPDADMDNEAVAVARQFPAMPVTARRRRKPKSALRTLIEVVIGGVAGCLVAYYVLAFYYGPEFRARGFPQLPLPGIAWITAPQSADDAKTTPPKKKPAKSKTNGANRSDSDTRSSCSPGQNVIQLG